MTARIRRTLIGHFIEGVLQDTRHRLRRERHLFAGKVPVRGSPYTVWELNECSHVEKR
jgi:hypothetical protein